MPATVPSSTLHSGLALAAWLILCYGVSLTGAQFTPDAWYDELAKPPWTPPDWLFPPVWLSLYTLMGVAAWLIWKQRDASETRIALSLFVGQLVCNGLWSWLFFGRHQIGLALADLSLLWLLLLLTVVVFWRHRPLAGILLVPYLLWAGFAWGLNFSIWQLNT